MPAGAIWLGIGAAGFNIIPAAVVALTAPGTPSYRAQDMKRALLAIRRWLPRRRRRFWRYVSPRRRGVGLLVLALLLAVVYAYWFATNDRRVRQFATDYLSEVTGGVVRIEGASFSFFGPIELTGVSVYAPDDDSPDPVFRASQVLLWHRPWGLFVHGGLQPTEIVCISPVVTLEHDIRTGSYNASRLLAAAPRPDSPAPSSLTAIRVREGLLRMVEKDGDLRQTVGQVNVELSVLPTGGSVYEVRFEQLPAGSTEAIRGSMELDVAAGEVRSVSGVLPLTTLEKALPRKYAQLRARYDIGGQVRLAGGQRIGPEARSVRAELHDVSLRLPDEEGGLKISQVNGHLVFDLEHDSVQLEQITGRLPQAGGASVTINGKYGGYEPESPFHVRMRFRNVSLPEADDVTGRLRETLAAVHRDYRPLGKMDLDVDISRREGEPPRVRGAARPEGMSARVGWLPHRLKGLSGAVMFNGDEVRLEDIRATHGVSEIELGGSVKGGLFEGVYDIRGRVRNLQLDDDLRGALPEEHKQIWRELEPTGELSFEFHASNDEPGGDVGVDATVLLGGNCSVSYRGFPYRLEKLYGKVHISGDTVVLDSVRGRRGQMSATIDGGIDGLQSGRVSVELDVEAASVPLDEAILEAVGDEAAAVIRSLHATGRAENVSARIRQDPGEPVDYTVLTRISGMTFRPDIFPCEVTDAEGVLTISPRSVVIESLNARRGESEIGMSGRVLLDREPAGFDLDIQAEDLTLDEELSSALPEQARGVWDEFSPRGVTDMSLSLLTGSADAPDAVDYHLKLSPKDMPVMYSGFPASFRATGGVVEAVPGSVELQGLTGSDGDMRAVIDGNIDAGLDSTLVDLAVRARQAVISESLLDSLPEGLTPLAERFRPGGTFDLDLDTLRFEIPAGDVAGSSEDDSPAPWYAEGRADFDDVVVDLGFGHKTLSGSVSGSGETTEEGLGLDARFALNRILVGKGEITDVTGQIVKPASSSRIRVNDILGNVYGGRMYGRGEIELSAPLEYALSLSVEDVEIEGLIEAGRGPAGDGESHESDVSGKLAGTIEYRTFAGRPESQQSTGRLRIYNGKLYRLPVPLELLYVVTLTVPGDAAFTDGNVLYELQGNDLTFREIHLRGPVLSVVGSGRLDMDTECLRLNFLTGPPGKVPRIAAELYGMLKPISRELVELRISGTLSEPGPPRTVTLGSLQNVINRLLNPERAE